jgi:Protein of unknown function (DUF3515)
VADEVTRHAARLATIITVPVVLLAGVLVFVLLGGAGGDSDEPAASPSPRPQATGPVAMPARKLTARQATVCRALLSQLPHALRDRVQRPVTAGSEQNAAYGDPAITLACGTTAPSFPPTETVLKTNSVCWYAATGSGGSVWTTLDREVPVTVTVPAGYDQPAQWVIEFANPVAAAVPSAKAPYGCG